ncbi:CRISPR-associated endonuclease Cas2 [Priestia koreensis]|uniref:CRISPR-associated endonuclease Cas2 n=1 Tax=Priestia koreensis TaxID=284581 RepID=UPI00203EBCA4|nr:CRISPR-associated endonuclease Cas2 [Priestia koreensis]MCM3005892.1 CRISPR-associated endonuclease Cas2 [Priestia koreensis]
MLVLITYDVSVISEGGQRRLRKVAKICQKYGQRVQNSVFECVINTTQFAQLQMELLANIDEDSDSLRFYRLGDNYKAKVQHIGVNNAVDIEGPLLF